MPNIIDLKRDFNLHKRGCETCVCYTQVSANCPEGKFISELISQERKRLIESLRKGTKHV